MSLALERDLKSLKVVFKQDLSWSDWEYYWRLINESRIVIADCTARNVNVFYEIGVAHTVGKDVILLCQNASEDIPIDIRTQRVIEYKIEDFQVALANRLPDLIENIIAERI